MLSCANREEKFLESLNSFSFPVGLIFISLFPLVRSKSVRFRSDLIFLCAFRIFCRQNLLRLPNNGKTIGEKKNISLEN